MNDGSNTPTAPPAPLTAAQINAYLSFCLEDLLRRRDQLVTALTATAKTYPAISNDSEMGEVGENLRMASALVRHSEAQRKDHKDPYLSGGRTVDAWFKAFFQPLDEARKPVQEAADAYTRAVVERERQRAAAAAAAAQEIADRAAAAAAAALAARKPVDVGALAGAERDAEFAASRAASRPSAISRSYGEYGAVISARSRWVPEVTDLAQVPRDYLMVDLDAVKRAMADRDASGRPTAIIPGISFIEVIRTGVR